jgi:hypothetical protein
MPENETLFPDARTASRWQPLWERIERGESPHEIFPEIRKQFYLALRSAFRRWVKRCVKPSQLFEAAQNGNLPVLHDLVNQAGNDYARLLRDAISGETKPDLEAVIGFFLNSAWDNARDQLQIDRCEDGVRDAFLKLADQMLEQLTRGLLKNPSRIPRLPPNRKPPPKIDDMLGESLL